MRTGCALSAHSVRTQGRNQTNLEISSDDYGSFKLLVIMKEKIELFLKIILKIYGTCYNEGKLSYRKTITIVKIASLFDESVGCLLMENCAKQTILTHF